MLAIRHSGRGTFVAKKMVDEALVEIEQTQKALRRSIEESKELAVKSEQLIKRHRKELSEGETSPD